MVQPLFAQFLADVWQGDAAAVGVLGTLMSLGQVVITAEVGKVADARGSIVAVAGNMFVFIGAMLCYVYVPSAALRLACMFLLGGFMAGQGVIYAGVGEILGPKAGGKAFALLSLAMAGVSVVGPYLGGFLYAGSPARPFVVAGAIAAAGALALARLGIAISSVRGGEVGQGTGTLGTDG
jgi:MFS family permease